MRERPILFSGAMVRALLSGAKTQTRRAVKRQFAANAEPAEMAATNESGWQISGHSGVWWDDTAGNPDEAIRCPFGAPGDKLWVREAWRIDSWDDGCGFWLDYCDGPRKVRLETDPDTAHKLILQTGDELERKRIKPTNGTMYEWAPGDSPLRWRPSIHMPRWASRITLEVTSVRVERLKDISPADCVEEGYASPPGSRYAQEELSALDWYRSLWEQINGPGSWNAAPWVWVIGFRRVVGAPE